MKTLHDTVEQIAASYCAEIVKHQPVGPYVLTGYSFGGLVAYEMARQFEQAHKTVGLLVMFDPILRMDEGGWAKLQRHAQAIKKRPLADKLDYALSRLGIFRDKVATDIIKRLSVLSVVWRTRRGHSLSDERRKAQFTLAQQATRRYRLNHYSGDVVLFTSARRAEPQWRSVIGGELAVHTIDCEHVALLSPPALHEIAKKLNEALRP